MLREIGRLRQVDSYFVGHLRREAARDQTTDASGFTLVEEQETFQALR